ncbi:unnamed protein product, partial [Oikopleura dioica]
AIFSEIQVVRSELRGPVPPPPGAGHNGHGMPPNSAPPSRSQIQFILDENTHLIECIINYQQKGMVQDCGQYQTKLHKNLVYLATAADKQGSGMGLGGPGGPAPAHPGAPHDQPNAQQPGMPQLGAPTHPQAPPASQTTPGPGHEGSRPAHQQMHSAPQQPQHAQAPIQQHPGIPNGVPNGHPPKAPTPVSSEQERPPTSQAAVSNEAPPKSPASQASSNHRADSQPAAENPPTPGNPPSVTYPDQENSISPKPGSEADSRKTDEPPKTPQETAPVQSPAPQTQTQQQQQAQPPAQSQPQHRPMQQSPSAQPQPVPTQQNPQIQGNPHPGQPYPGFHGGQPGQNPAHRFPYSQHPSYPNYPGAPANPGAYPGAQAPGGAYQMNQQHPHHGSHQPPQQQTQISPQKQPSTPNPPPRPESAHASPQTPQQPTHAQSTNIPQQSPQQSSPGQHPSMMQSPGGMIQPTRAAGNAAKNGSAAWISLRVPWSTWLSSTSLSTARSSWRRWLPATSRNATRIWSTTRTSRLSRIPTARISTIWTVSSPVPRGWISGSTATRRCSSWNGRTPTTATRTVPSISSVTHLELADKLNSRTAIFQRLSSLHTNNECYYTNFR